MNSQKDKTGMKIPFLDAANIVFNKIKIWGASALVCFEFFFFFFLFEGKIFLQGSTTIKTKNQSMKLILLCFIFTALARFVM